MDTNHHTIEENIGSTEFGSYLLINDFLFSPDCHRSSENLF
jgi:hypothetical protein